MRIFADLAIALTRVFTRFGFDVRVTPDGPATLAAVRQAPPDLLVLDVLMPYMSGLAVCRADPRTVGVPILMMSASAFAEDFVAGREASADDYLSKPFDSTELVARALLLRWEAEPGPMARKP